jgi:phospholipase/carboxylesterase
MRWPCALAMLVVVAAPACDPGPPALPVNDPSIEEPSREAFLGVEFLTLFERKARTTSPLIVALHGRGETRETFAKVWRRFPARVEIALPNGRLPYAGGAQWFDWPPGLTDDALAEAVSAAEARLWPAIAALARGRKIILAGFSQGAILVYAMAVRHPDEIACAFPIAGQLPARLRPQGGARTAPVYALHGTDDPQIPIAAARETITALAAAGGTAELRELPATGHALSPAMRDELLTRVGAVVANLEKYAPRAPGAEPVTSLVAPAPISR